MMEKEVNTKMELYGMLTSRGKYLNNPKYLEFRQSIWVRPHHAQSIPISLNDEQLNMCCLTVFARTQEATGESAGLPPLKTLIQREEADPDSSDDEIEMQEGAQNFKDPILMTWLVKPVRK